MISNPLIDSAAEVTTEERKSPIRELMRDGVWMVPEYQRPKGWEKMMEIREPVVSTVCLAPLPAPTVAKAATVAKHERQQTTAGALPCALKELPDKTSSEPAGYKVFDPKGEPHQETQMEGNHTDPAVRSKAEELLRSGLGVREVMRQTGLAKNTVLRLRVRLGDLGSLPRCECGKAGGHRGWCAPRLQKSPAGQKTIRKMHERQRSATETPKPTAQPTNPYEAMIADLEAKRDVINNAIAALRALMG